MLPPLVTAILAVKSRHGPRRTKPGTLHGDKAYDQPALRRWVRDHGIRVRVARIGTEPRDKLDRHRWVIERSLAWFTGYRRLPLRYERRTDLFTAFLTLRHPHLLQKLPT